jgi:dTDP-4-amino-4,6-dideoxygalactose transaminase
MFRILIYLLFFGVTNSLHPIFINNRYNFKDKDLLNAEKNLANYIGHSYSLGVNSGGMALTLSLIAIKNKYNLSNHHPIFTNSFTFNAVPSSIVNANFDPYLLETDDKLLLDLDNLEYHLSNSKIKRPVLLLSYMRGRIPNINKLMNIVKKYNVILIEDCAHAYGCLWNKKKLGSFGEISIISCQSNKLISTSEGGFILTSDDELMACSLIASGCYEDLYLKHDFLSPSKNIIDKYKFTIPNYSVRMTPLQGYIFNTQFKNIENTIKQINKNYEYLKSLNSNPYIQYIEQYPNVRPVYDSLQFRIMNISESEFEFYITTLNQLGNYNFQSFLSSDNARLYKNWQFFNNNFSLPNTQINLLNVCDFRIPIDYTLDDLYNLNDNMDRAFYITYISSIYGTTFFGKLYNKN